MTVKELAVLDGLNIAGTIYRHGPPEEDGRALWWTTAADVAQVLQQDLRLKEEYGAVLNALYTTRQVGSALRAMLHRDRRPPLVEKRRGSSASLWQMSQAGLDVLSS